MKFNMSMYKNIYNSIDKTNQNNCKGFEKQLRFHLPELKDYEVDEIKEYLDVEHNIKSDRCISQMSLSQIKDLSWFINFIGSYHEYDHVES